MEEHIFVDKECLESDRLENQWAKERLYTIHINFIISAPHSLLSLE